LRVSSQLLRLPRARPGRTDVKLPSVHVDRLRRWSCPGLLRIGDAAHAMSPIAGVGINLAVQDAVAAANALAEPLRRVPARLIGIGVRPEHIRSRRAA